jgi:UDP-N-acetylmuramoyl-tripeptide--D-alanyl-D-alanine ligase
MFFTEYYHAKWKDYEVYGDYVIVLAHWIIHTHEILWKNRNTGYAYEGIISAYQIAKERGHREAINDFEYTIDEGLYELGRWQVGGPLANKNNFLVEHPTDEAIAVGGVMNAVNQSPLRIDTTQHQMHAVMMAMAEVYLV